jgi:molecular chaperone GrpE
MGRSTPPENDQQSPDMGRGNGAQAGGQTEAQRSGGPDPLAPPAAEAAGAMGAAGSAGTPAAGTEAAAEPTAGPTDLAAALAQAQAEAAEFKDAFMRAKAEAENARRRAQDEVAKAHKFGTEAFAESLVPVKDSLEAALAVQNATLDSYRDGINITLRQLDQAFSRNNMQPIAPAAGEKFDPNRHQAISMVPSAEVPAQCVVTVLQKGYLIAERVLRPALVTVSQGPGAS